MEMKPGSPYWRIWPELKGKLSDKPHWFGHVPEGQDPPKGKVVRYTRGTRFYLVEKEGRWISKRKDGR